MKNLLIAAMLGSTAMTGAALAQEAATASMDWSGPVGQALFTDESMATARTGEELQSNWQNLDQEQQQQVRAHCQNLQTQTGGATTGGATTTTGATSGTDAGGAADAGSTEMATGGTDAGGTGGMAGQPGSQQMASICSEIENF